jgi:hypothetical protein
MPPTMPPIRAAASIASASVEGAVVFAAACDSLTAIAGVADVCCIISVELALTEVSPIVAIEPLVMTIAVVDDDDDDNNVGGAVAAVDVTKEHASASHVQLMTGFVVQSC